MGFGWNTTKHSFFSDAFWEIGNFALDLALVNTKKTSLKKECMVVSHAVIHTVIHTDVL